jgi:hypothetical protein
MFGFSMSNFKRALKRKMGQGKENNFLQQQDAMNRKNGCSTEESI